MEINLREIFIFVLGFLCGGGVWMLFTWREYIDIKEITQTELINKINKSGGEYGLHADSINNILDDNCVGMLGSTRPNNETEQKN